MKRLTVSVAAVLLLLVSQGPSKAELVLSIDITTQQIDWLNGFSITRLPAEFDNNAFGTYTVPGDLRLLSPLLLYSGAGSHYAVEFDFSADGSAILGIALYTTQPPGFPASFSGTPEGPAAGSSLFAGLHLGDYTLAPNG